MEGLSSLTYLCTVMKAYMYMYVCETNGHIFSLPMKAGSLNANGRIPEDLVLTSKYLPLIRGIKSFLRNG